MTPDKAWIIERRRRNKQAEKMLCRHCNTIGQARYLGEIEDRLVYCCQACGFDWSVELE